MVGAAEVWGKRIVFDHGSVSDHLAADDHDMASAQRENLLITSRP